MLIQPSLVCRKRSQTLELGTDHVSVAGKATLNTAAYMGMEQLVQRLVLHYPVDINLHCATSLDFENHLTRSLGDVGGTPLQAAILGLHIPIVRFLLEHGADPNTGESLS